MKKILFITLLSTFYSLQALGNFYFSPGAILTTSFDSKEKASNGSEYMKSSAGIGLGLDFEINLFAGLSFAFMGSYSIRSADVEYSYTDPNNTSVTNTTSDLKSSFATITGYAGMRWRIINFKSFKILVGGGVLGGGSTLVHDDSDFQDKNNESLLDYKNRSSASFEGYYYEAGIGYYWNDTNGLRVQSRKIHYKTKDFETLGKNRITADYFQIGVYYNHIIDMSFFWK